MRLLIVEDEKKMAAFLHRALAEAGYSVQEVHDGVQAVETLKGEVFDAVVLDLTLPKCDGLTVLRHLRGQGRTTPVLILSARGQAEDRIAGLNLGADDYLPKPFSTDELVARVDALLRGKAGGKASRMEVAGLVLDPGARTATRDGVPIDLSLREYKLLEYLVQCSGRILTHAQILEHVWGYHFDPGTNVVSVYVLRLRQKVDAGHERKLIHTHFGVGYRLSPDP